MDSYGPSVGVDSKGLWHDSEKGNTVLGVMDRRGKTRYDLRTQVRFSWKDPDGIRHDREGLTRDISEVGIFVLTDFHPPFGANVRFEVSYPSASAQQVRIQAQGQVVRIEGADPSRAQGGFAAATKVIKLFSHERDDKDRGPGPTGDETAGGREK
jgi:PilZ domain